VTGFRIQNGDSSLACWRAFDPLHGPSGIHSESRFWSSRPSKSPSPSIVAVPRANPVSVLRFRSVIFPRQRTNPIGRAANGFDRVRVRHMRFPNGPPIASIYEIVPPRPRLPWPASRHDEKRDIGRTPHLDRHVAREDLVQRLLVVLRECRCCPFSRLWQTGSPKCHRALGSPFEFPEMPPHQVGIGDAGDTEFGRHLNGACEFMPPASADIVAKERFSEILLQSPERRDDLVARRDSFRA